MHGSTSNLSCDANWSRGNNNVKLLLTELTRYNPSGLLGYHQALLTRVLIILSVTKRGFPSCISRLWWGLPYMGYIGMCGPQRAWLLSRFTIELGSNRCTSQQIIFKKTTADILKSRIVFFIFWFCFFVLWTAVIGILIECNNFVWNACSQSISFSLFCDIFTFVFITRLYFDQRIPS